MSEEQVIPVGHRRRSSAEIRRLVEEFVQSGLRQSEFCRQRGVVLNTLKRYLKRDRDRKVQKSKAGGGALVAVEVTAASPAQSREPHSSLAVVLSSGRRIEVGERFDAATLARLVAVLERL
jgi:transposase-like protein